MTMNDSKRWRATRRFPVAMWFLVTATAQAAITDTTVIGIMGPTAQGCLQALTQTVGQSENCMYDGGPAAGISNPTGEITGPYSQVQYYDSAATPQAFDLAFVPTHASGQINQAVDGTITIDDKDTPADASDDRISFTLTLRSPGNGDVIRHLNSSVVDRYTSMTQVLISRTVDSAVPNSHGGYNYVIGSEGFPSLLVFDSPTEPDAVPCGDQPFGFMDCLASFNTTATDPDRWFGTTSAGLGSLEGNIGARTTGTLQNPTCVNTDGSPPNGVPNCQDSKVSFAPRVIHGLTSDTLEDVGWDQLLLRVSTDASHRVMSLAGFDVQEYQVFGGTVIRCGSDPNPQGPCNSWISGHFVGLGAIDDDNDGIYAGADNCLNTANTNQRDTNNDGYGNRCDADLDGNNFVNAADLAIFRSLFGTSNADADFDGNGFVNAADLAIFRALFGKAPGPSGLDP